MTQREQLELGKRLGEVRALKGDTLEQLADRLSVSKSYLSKIENGHKPVSEALLRRYVQVYGKSARFKEVLRGHKVVHVQTKEGERGKKSMEADVQQIAAPQKLQVNLNPETTHILYSDWQGVNSNDGGVVINFAQSATPLPIQQIVSRVGMTHGQAKELYKSLGDVLKEYYKSKDMEF